MSQAETTIRHGEETEEQLVAIAQEAVSQCRWVVGECAAKWTQRYSRGRTDADFAMAIGLSGDQVYQRRRVWETFGSVRGEYTHLKWSHFYTALTWDDGADCLRWAEDMQATVAEMRAWRRAQRGEDLTADALPEEGLQYLPTEPTDVLDPSAVQGGARGSSAGGMRSPDDAAAMPAVARHVEGGEEEYTPYRTGAASPPSGSSSGEKAPPLTPEQLARKLASTFERCAKLMTIEFCREVRQLPESVREKLQESSRELQSRLSQLK